jgi:hypothetical protein
MHILSYKCHLDKATYNCPWDQDDYVSKWQIQTVPSGAVYSVMVSACETLHTIVNTKFLVKYYITTRSAQLFAV